MHQGQPHYDGFKMNPSYILMSVRQLAIVAFKYIFVRGLAAVSLV